MPLEIRSLQDSEIDSLRALVTHPSLAVEFDVFTSAGQLEHVLADPLTDRRICTVAWEDGRAVGFTLGYAIPQADGSRHVFLRLGVHGEARRRGAGSALLGNVRAAMRRWPPSERPRETALNHWVPNDVAEAFMTHHEFAPVRYFWRMHRAPDAALEACWPPGVTLRPFDHSESAFADWTEAYNDSFAQHYRFIPATLDVARMIAASPDFKPEYLMLAYRDRRCAGFCRNEAIGETGVIDVLGVVHAARGIGLGRALLRWGVASLSRQGFERVALFVDGENQTALSLYRSEGFEVARTRRYWERPL